MNRTATALAIAAAFAAPLAGQGAPRRTAAPATLAMLRAASGADPFAVLRAWARDEAIETEAPLLAERADALDAAFHELVVCGLWSDDPDVAFASACHVEEGRLDLRDIDRFVDVVSPHVFAERQRYDQDTFKHVVDPDQVARLLDGRPVWRADIRSFFIGDLHRSLRPEHIPALQGLAHHDDPLVREQAFSAIALLARHTHRYRDNVATALVQWPGPGAFVLGDYEDRSRNPPYAPRAFELAADDGGFSPLLRAALDHRLTFAADVDPRLSFDGWLLRWADAERPNAADRARLEALLAHDRPWLRWIGLRGSARLPDTGDVLARFAAAPGREPIERALALCASRPTDELAQASHDDAALLAALLERDPARALAAWLDRALGEDETSGRAALALLAAAREFATWGPVRLPTAVFDRARGPIDAAVARLDPARLALLATTLPECRTPALAERCLSALPVADLDEAVAAMLELHDAARLRQRLLDAVRAPDSAGRSIALDLLLRLGAPEVGEALVEHVLMSEDRDLHLLARSAEADPVREWLDRELAALEPNPDARPRAEDFRPLTAAAMARGLPEPTSRAWEHELATAPHDLVARELTAWRRLVLDGDPVAAIVAFVAALPPHRVTFHGLGHVADPRVLALLARLRATPGTMVQHLIGELALAGEPEASAELAEVRARRLYGWMDDASVDVRTLGRRLDLVPYWIGEVETVCCRRNGAAVALDALTGYDVHAVGEDGLATQHEAALAFWRRFGPHLRQSRITGRFAVAPH